MTKHTLQQSHGPAYTRIYAVGAARGENVGAERRPGRPDQLLRRVDPAAHRHHRRAREPAPRSRRSTSRRTAAQRGDREVGRRARAHRPRHRRHHLQRAADAVDGGRRSPTGSARTPPPPTTSNAACAGYAYAIAQADALIRTGVAHYALVVGAEKLSDVVDPTDRSISFLLGDGAGAVVDRSERLRPASPAPSGAPTARRPTRWA